MTLKHDLDTIFVAIDRLRVHGYEYRWGGQKGDVNLANRALISLENVRERLANSVPIEQGEIEV